MSLKLQNKKFRFPVTALIGSNLSNFLIITKKYRVDQKYRSKYLFTKQVCRILGSFAYLERKKTEKKLKNYKIEKSPVFIIGFWRSGTTLLHNLMCKNSSFGYVTTYQTVFPNHVLFNQKWLKTLMKPAVPEKRPTDNMKFDFEYPQEEEFALGNMQPISFYNFFYFPDEIEKIIDESLYFKNISAEEMQRWKQEYIRMLKTAMLNTGGERFVSKNPPNTFRIKQLLEIFPDARFIFLHRNRYDTLSSFRRFVHSVNEGITLQDYDKELLDIHLIRLYKLLHEKYNEDRKLIPKGHLTEIEFTDFEKNKLAEIERVYKELGLDGYEEALPAMKEHLASIGTYKRMSYDPEDDFIKLIDKELKDFKRMKY